MRFKSPEHQQGADQAWPSFPPTSTKQLRNTYSSLPKQKPFDKRGLESNRFWYLVKSKISRVPLPDGMEVVSLHYPYPRTGAGYNLVRYWVQSRAPHLT